MMPAFLSVVRIVDKLQVFPKDVGVLQLHVVALVSRKDTVKPSCDVCTVKGGNGGHGALEG